jgi:hypothetical protein
MSVKKVSLDESANPEPFVHWMVEKFKIAEQDNILNIGVHGRFHEVVQVEKKNIICVRWSITYNNKNSFGKSFNNNTREFKGFTVKRERFSRNSILHR